MSLTGKVAAERTLRGKISKLDVIYTDTYEIAVKNGYKGTVEEWLASLKGDPGEKGDKGEKGETGATGAAGKDGADGKSPYQYAQEAGFVGTEEEFAELLLSNSIKQYGAKGDGVTDDTAAFQEALANERVVFVPGGTYKLSDTLLIRENCCLELSQDTVLKFTQTEGNCIEMRGSAVLRGNHGLLWAAYGLTGHVIDMDTLKDGMNHASIPPYSKADPQWKRQRFVYDANIIKPNASGFNRPLEDGVCSGTAIYMSATNLPTSDTNPNNADIPFMWGITMSGIRIAGGFSYGIHAINHDCVEGSDDAWNHDMRIEAVIEGCEVGVELENCNGAHLNVTIQPNTTPGGVKYAKHGFVLRDSRYVDMLRSRVWDWHVARDDSEEYKHIALYGNCRGLLLDDFLVTEHPSIDIRDDIYTDTPSNFDTMTILQEPANKWFKSIDNAPYFNNGTANRKLMLATDKFTAEQAEFIHPADGYYTYEPNFTNLVGGYEDGKYLAAGGAVTAMSGYATSDFIPLDGAAVHTYRIGGKDIVFKDAYGYGRIAWYDADKNIVGDVMSHNKIGSNIYYPEWVDDEAVNAAFVTTENVSPPIGAAYFRITVQGKGENLVVTIDEKQEYNAIWHGEPKRLDDSIKVKAENVIGSGGSASSNIVELMPKTEFQYSADDGFFSAQTDFELAAGRTYIIEWNGVEYTSKAEASLYGNAMMIAVGNPAFSGGEDNGLPFVIGRTLLVPTAKGLIFAIPLDGSTSVTVSIKGEKDVQSDVLLLDARMDLQTGELATVYATPEQIFKAYWEGKRITTICSSGGMPVQATLNTFAGELIGRGDEAIVLDIPTMTGRNVVSMYYNGNGAYVAASE